MMVGFTGGRMHAVLARPVGADPSCVLRSPRARRSPVVPPLAGWGAVVSPSALASSGICPRPRPAFRFIALQRALAAVLLVLAVHAVRGWLRRLLLRAPMVWLVSGV